MVFLGLIVMENKLKEATTEVIRTLHQCNVRTIMATGDNVLTAVSVAKQCKLLDPNKKVFLGELTSSVTGRQYV